MKVQHNCGLVVAHTLHDAYSMIKELQHRGREGTGIAAIGKTIDVVKWEGPVSKLDLEDFHKIFPGNKYHTYMAHVRYATRGKSNLLNETHPHTIGGKISSRGDHILIKDCDYAMVHNGQVNRKWLNDIGNDCKTNCDSEAILHFYAKHGEIELMEKIPLAYTLAIADKNKKDVIAMRDRTGIKPGVLGWKNGKFCIASEDIALWQNGGKYIQDLIPGSIYYLTPEGDFTQKSVISPIPKFCYFEYNYIGHPGSRINSINVRSIREELGRAMANYLSTKINIDDINLVTYLPRCPEIAAQTLAQNINKPFEPLFYKMRGDRAFQNSKQTKRTSSIRGNLHLLPDVDINGKVVLCVDDSTIRGTNIVWELIKLKEAGARKIIHINYTPPIGIVGNDGDPRGCLWGVDMPPEDNFIARSLNEEQISEKLTKEVGIETKLFYLPLNIMLEVFEKLGIKKSNLCYYCIGGPKPFPQLKEDLYKAQK